MDREMTKITTYFSQKYPPKNKIYKNISFPPWENFRCSNVNKHRIHISGHGQCCQFLSNWSLISLVFRLKMKLIGNMTWHMIYICTSSYFQILILKFQSFQSINIGKCNETDIIHKTKTNPVLRIEHGTSGGSVFL